MQLAQNAVHGAMAGYTAFSAGVVNNRTVGAKMMPSLELFRGVTSWKVEILHLKRSVFDPLFVGYFLARYLFVRPRVILAHTFGGTCTLVSSTNGKVTSTGTVVQVG